MLTVEDAEQTLSRSGVEILPAEGTRTAPVARRPPVRAMIEYDDVRFAYPDGPQILSGVSLTIGEGEFVAVMGPNGAGKSTLGKQLNGLLRPTSGEVRVDGKPTKDVRTSELASKVGYVFQNPDHQIVAQTVAAELALGPKNLGWSNARVRGAVDHALDFLGLSHRRNEDPFMLGLAERNLVALATALIVEPKILVLDEPATGADYAIIQRLLRRVAELHAAGMTVLMVTHDAGIVAQYAQRLVVIAHGVVFLDGTPAEVFGRVDELAAAQITPPPIPLLSQRLQRAAGRPGPLPAVTVEALSGTLTLGTQHA